MVEWGSSYSIINDFWGCSWAKEAIVIKCRPIYS
jgi:hypothetical protein